MTETFHLLPRLEPRRAAELRRGLLQRADACAFDPGTLYQELSGARVFPATGGRRITENELLGFRQSCLDELEALPSDLDRGAAFDLAMGRRLHALGSGSRGELGVAAVWDFLTLVLLPDLALHRLRTTSLDVRDDSSTRRRLTGGDRRHVLQRLWKRRVVFGDEIVEARDLTEDDYVALLERRLTLERGAVARQAARTIVGSGLTGGARREYTRILMRRLVQLSGIVHLSETDAGHLADVFEHLHRQTVEAMQASRSR